MTWICSYKGIPRTVVHSYDYFGLPSCDLAGPFRRCYADVADPPPLYEPAVDAGRLVEMQTPTQLLGDPAIGSSPLAATTRAQARLYASFLLADDPQRRLEATKAASLLHQLSLIQHIFEHPSLSRVLIADEVGLGKTIEAALLIRRHIEQRPRARVLYLAPARLVSNVVREFRSKFGLDARRWSACESDARLESDALVVASMQKAVHPSNIEAVTQSGPWDILVVDECHHLSDWAEGGGSPNKGYRLVRDLAQKLSSDGRLILLSGTPHQGHEARFKNILRLLQGSDKTTDSVAGRVIFRTKEMVADWDGRPLFPKREIRPLTVVPMECAGIEFADWYVKIAALYGRGQTTRGSGWAKSQALQWAASSAEAGLGLLCRLAIRRLRWDSTNRSLSKALEAIRPYRGGASNESVAQLYQRICRLIDQQQSSAGEEQEDGEFYDEEAWRPDPKQLAELLEQGVRLVESNAAETRWGEIARIIEHSGGDKIVFFAQPVETVSAFSRYLQQKYGSPPAVIMGGQDETERDSIIASFWRADGPRFLVSSRAGGEGINLQCSRRLVHLDVPWNPMELEQRIGRVHRFGSRQTVIVDTLVLAGTREADVYRVARDKLRLIARQLDPEQFETLFSRVMSSVAPEEFQGVLEAADFGVDAGVQDEIGAIVRRGFDQWRAFNDRYSKEQQNIKALNPGAARATDLHQFMVAFGGARSIDGVHRLTFSKTGDDVTAAQERVDSFAVDGMIHVCAETYGMPIDVPKGFGGFTQAGTNTAPVNGALRDALFPSTAGACGFVRLSRQLRDIVGPDKCALMAFVIQTIKLETGHATELNLELKLFSVDRESVHQEHVADERARIVRHAVAAARRRDVERSSFPELNAVERRLFDALRVPSKDELSLGIRKAVWPICLLLLADGQSDAEPATVETAQ